MKSLFVLHVGQCLLLAVVCESMPKANMAQVFFAAAAPGLILSRNVLDIVSSQ